MRKYSVILLTIILSISVSAQRVRIAAAASLRYPLEDIKTLYTARHPEVRVDITLGASGALTTQILNGAQFDLFMSADRTYPEKLVAAGAGSGDVRTYAYGRLVLWSTSVDVSRGVATVADSSIVHIAIANPETAPYGDRAIQVLKHYGLYEKVKGKIVYADNIAQAAQYAATGNAEAGFLALSLVLTPEMKEKGHMFLVDSTAYAPIAQACVLVKTWERNGEASEFMDFLFGESCRPVFEKYGFSLP